MTNESTPIEQRDVNLGNLIWSRFNVDGAGDEARRAAIYDIAQFRIACAPTAVDGGLVEQVAQFLHDEGGFDDAWNCRTWPEHPDDTGQRDGGFVKIVPSDVQAKFRDVARRLVAGFTQSIRAKALEDAAKVAEWAHMVPPDGGSPSDAEYEVAKNAAAAIRSLKGEQSS